jgi:hypothetical protein
MKFIFISPSTLTINTTEKIMKTVFWSWPNMEKKKTGFRLCARRAKKKILAEINVQNNFGVSKRRSKKKETRLKTFTEITAIAHNLQ